MANATNKLPKLRLKYAEFVEHYFEKDVKFNGTEAHQRTYPNASRETSRREAHKLLTRHDIQSHIQARFAERRMGTDEAVDILTQQARADMGEFFKVVDEWTFFPLSTDEILDMKEVEEDDDEDKPRKKKGEPKVRIMYRVRKVVLDVDKITNPKYSHLIKEFTDKGRDGMSIKIHDPQRATDQVLRVLGAYKDKEEKGDNPGPTANVNIYIPDNGRG